MNATVSSVASEVLALTDANMTLLTTGVWLIVIHAQPWCPYSAELMRRWTNEIAPALQGNASLQFHSNGSLYRIAELDATRNTKTAALLEVQAFPTVKLVQKGFVWTYRDSLNFTTPSLVAFASDGWKDSAWYNRLPTTWSLWFKLQLDIFNAVCAAMVSFEAATGHLAASPNLSNLLAYSMFMIVVLGIGVLLPFGIIYLIT
ncbi:hypothetical protein BC830DRAFT_1175494 [Chytriomyces sp. MP71]|nr:hypothetical protein BC830DRAFT_1175494 [Chytriomyces sp. MP71]